MAGRSHALRFEAWLSPPVKETGLRVDEVLRIVGEDRIDACLDQAGIDRKRFAASESDRNARHNTRREASLWRKRLKPSTEQHRSKAPPIRPTFHKFR